MGMTFLFFCRQGAPWRLLLKNKENWMLYIQPCSLIPPASPGTRPGLTAGANTSSQWGCSRKITSSWRSSTLSLCSLSSGVMPSGERWAAALEAGALKQCCDTCVLPVLLGQKCQWSFSALQPPLLYREGESVLAIDDAEEAVVSWTRQVLFLGAQHFLEGILWASVLF